MAFDLGLAMGITTNSSTKLVNYLRNVDLPNAHQAMIRVNILVQPPFLTETLEPILSEF